MPIELVTFTPVVSFTSADGVRRRMTLDTGSDVVLVTPGLVAACRLATRPSNRSHRDASGTWGGTPVAILDKLELGAVRFEDFDADVVGLQIGSDALLGWPLFRDVLLTIDYPRRMLILKRGSLPGPDGKRVLPLRLDHDRLMVPATLDGREMWLNLDTGFGSGDSVDLTPARAAEVAWASPAVPTMAAHTPGGAVGQKVGRLKGDLVLGCYRFVQPVAGTNDGIAVDILSAWALANFTLTLDLRNMRAQFDCPGDAPIRTGPVSVAGFDCDLTSQPLKVTGILPGGEAERAGLHVGDRLLTIDGRPALEGFLSHAGGAYTIELQRGQRKATLTVPLTRLVP
ncbi:MAG TPA: aspartyl protease family protein [Tepidisphaeraceae bacterium]|nr:aspartyl protease family protein [Tepidisphaeraceae bacterium]